VLQIEADAVRALIERIDERFLAAVELIHGRTGRVVVSGIGKSGHIARKIASTMASTGTPAYFVHPAEASHGDLGMVESGDVFIAIVFRGKRRLLDIVPLVKRRGQADRDHRQGGFSAGARGDVHLDAAVARERSSTSRHGSTTAALALGGARRRLLGARGSSKDDFARPSRDRLPHARHAAPSRVTQRRGPAVRWRKASLEGGCANDAAASIPRCATPRAG
jgi:arabinose-5-phosphate isomerase